MKKTFLTVALAAAASQAAWAQSNVTVYGQVDMAFVRESGGPAGTVNRLDSGVEGGSRLGFRGTEDLGGGLKAHFVLESGFQMDTGGLGQGGLLFGRQAHVGMTNRLGSLFVGRQYTTLFYSVNAIDPFGGFSMAPTSSNMLALGGIRVNNAIKYTSPVVGGVSGEITYGLGEVAGDNDAGRSIGLGLGYTNGPWNVRAAYHNANTIPVAPAVIQKGITRFIGATYDFGAAKVAMAYAVNRGNVIAGAAVNRDTADLLLGVTVPFGAHTVKASYIRKNDKAGNADANQIGVGYTYALSKRTNFFTSYARINNDVAPGTPGFYTVGNGSSLGTGDKAFNFGIHHNF